MLAYNCENCNKIILWGCFNEYNQHFCNENCYLLYCEKHKYIPDVKNLTYIKSIFDNHT